MQRRVMSFLVFFIGLCPLSQVIRAEVSAVQVRDAIQLGMRFLKSQQSPINGSWPERAGQPGGLSALCALALIECGEPVDSQNIQKTILYLESLGEPKATYSAAMRILLYAAVDPDKYRLQIRRDAEWLQATQIRGNEAEGAWTYFGTISQYTRGDNSNSQFALLGLQAAERAGVELEPLTWQRALDYWQSCQRRDGSWAYYKDRENQPKAASTGSMTCAGISAVVIASGRLNEGDARVQGGLVQCCCEQQDDADLERAFQWLANKFTVHANPGPVGGPNGIDISQSGLFYYLYGVERIGRFTGRRFIGKHDWYREGAEMLVASQDGLQGFWEGEGHGEDNRLIASSFALLFLAKGRRPVVIAKLKHGYDDDWNLHRSALRNLTMDVEQRWKRKLTWQVIDGRAATVSDLLETPVLFLSGRSKLDLTPEQKSNLRDFVNQNGFIFAEACTGGDAFDASFRELMKELFPDNSLRLLPPEHPVWFAEQQIDAKYLPHLYGIDACCRTSVVYCPRDLSCYWELSRGKRESNYPPAVQEEVDACLAIGANVLAYATNRQLKEKLDRPKLEEGDLPDDARERGAVIIPKINHNGGAAEAANALPNLLRAIRREIKLPIRNDAQLLSPASPEVFDFPIAFIHGRRDFQFTPLERKGLALYLRRGGFLFGDAICASPQFAAAFRREIKRALPEAEFVRLDPNHPLFSKQFRGYDLPTVQLRDPQTRAGNDPLRVRVSATSPVLEGVELNGRLAVVFSPYDISCALENHASLECKGYTKADAARLGTNIILFALQQ